MPRSRADANLNAFREHINNHVSSCLVTESHLHVFLFWIKDRGGLEKLFINVQINRAPGQMLSANASEQKVVARLARRGTNGVSTNGVDVNLMFFDRGTFWVLPLTYLCLSKSARAYLFPQPVKRHYICSGPISVDPICPQPIGRLLPLAHRASGRGVGASGAVYVHIYIYIYVSLSLSIYIYRHFWCIFG